MRYSNVTWVVFFITLILAVKAFFVSVYLIPTSSMEPSVLPGDRVIVSTFSYALRIPFIDKPMLQLNMPKRGDVIVFRSADKKQTFIKRVIGLPGDRIEFLKGHVVINGVELDYTNAKNYLAFIDREGSTKTNNATDTAEAVATATITATSQRLTESASEKNLITAHDILMSLEPAKTFFEDRRFFVPKDSVFVLGDNRDVSLDSRAFNSVPLASIYGKATHILFSTTGLGNSFLLPDFRQKRVLQSIW